MATYKTLKEAQEVFKGDRFATVNGMQIDELGEDWYYPPVVVTINEAKPAATPETIEKLDGNIQSTFSVLKCV